jgi:uncharacterized membrane protein YccC
VPTTRPRYTFTDTGHLEELLDAAQKRWPQVTDRKQLLMMLAQEGHSAIESSAQQLTDEERHNRVQAALSRIPALVDAELLLSDRAWS